MTLSNYVKKRNGVPMGHTNSLKNNLHRSFGAKNFSSFWQYWNPIFGYYLGKYIFKPLKTFVQPPIALIITFLFCGLVHDLVGLLVLKKTSFLFANWFLFMALIVLVSKRMKHDFSNRKWNVRAIINLFLISVCFWMAMVTKTLIGVEIIV